MRIITLLKKTEDGEPIEYGVGETAEDYTHWWGVIDTHAEELAYEDFLKHLGEYVEPRKALWNEMLIDAGRKKGVSWGDDDMYGYIRPDEDVPDIGLTLTDSNGDEWVRLN